MWSLRRNLLTRPLVSALVFPTKNLQYLFYTVVEYPFDIQNILWDIVNAHAKPKERRKTINVFRGSPKDFGALWSKKHLGKKYEQVIANVIKIQAYHKGYAELTLTIVVTNRNYYLQKNIAEKVRGY